MPTKVEGPLKILLIVIAVFTLLVVVGTFVGPFTTEYEVKTAARVACNDYKRVVGWKGGDDRQWEKTFVSAARTKGVRLEPNQYDFELGTEYDLDTCRIRVKWFEDIPIFLLSDATDIKPIRYLHSIDYMHKVKKRY